MVDESMPSNSEHIKTTVWDTGASEFTPAMKTGQQKHHTASARKIMGSSVEWLIYDHK
jgi:hypothetical protein